MSSNGSKNDLDKLFDRVDALKEKIEGNPELMAAIQARMSDAEFVGEMRQSARQRVLKARGLEPSQTEIDADWLAEQLEENKIDVAMLLLETFWKTFWLNTAAGIKSLLQIPVIFWRLLMNRRVRGKRG